MPPRTPDMAAPPMASGMAGRENDATKPMAHIAVNPDVRPNMHHSMNECIPPEK